MRDIDKTEVAFNNGYSRGYKDGLEAGGIKWHDAKGVDAEPPNDGTVTYIVYEDGTLDIAEFFLGAWLIDEPEKVAYWMEKPAVPKKGLFR